MIEPKPEPIRSAGNGRPALKMAGQKGKRMKKMFCEYCGAPLEDGCDCLREIAEEREQFIEDYENRPDVQYGWAQQDLIDLRRREQ